MTVIIPICRIHCNILAVICSSELYSVYKHDNQSVSLSDNDFELLVLNNMAATVKCPQCFNLRRFYSRILLNTSTTSSRKTYAMPYLSLKYSNTSTIYNKNHMLILRHSTFRWAFKSS